MQEANVCSWPIAPFAAAQNSVSDWGVSCRRSGPSRYARPLPEQTLVYQHPAPRLDREPPAIRAARPSELASSTAATRRYAGQGGRRLARFLGAGWHGAAEVIEPPWAVTWCRRAKSRVVYGRRSPMSKWSLRHRLGMRARIISLGAHPVVEQSGQLHVQRRPGRL